MARAQAALLLLAACALAPAARGQAPAELVKDINPGFDALASSNPARITAVGSVAYFEARPEDEATELWRTDATAAGTERIKVSAGSPTEFGASALFWAYEPQTGYELWRVDPASEPTLLKDIQPGPGSSAPYDFAVSGGVLYFGADDGVRGRELWRSDGTEAGTTLVADIAPGPASSSPTSLVDVNGALYIVATDGSTGRELWRSDGTAAGTALVKDIRAGSLDASIALLTRAGGRVFFTASDGSGTRLWTSDGSGAGTLALDAPSAGWINELVDVAGTLFFAADELWKSDGTQAGTLRVADLAGLANSYPAGLTNWAGTLYLIAVDGSTSRGLYRSDGTAGTVHIRPVGGPSGAANPNMRVANGSLYFRADGPSVPEEGLELWTSDGTGAGTRRVKDIRPGSSSSRPGPVTVSNGVVLFSADDGAHGVELWRSDGTDAGTVLVKDVEPPAPEGSYPSSLTVSGSKLFFSAIEPVAGAEPWVSDGTDGGTFALDVQPGAASSNPEEFLDCNGRLLFQTGNNVDGPVWSSDGTPAGTVPIDAGTSVHARAIARANATCFIEHTYTFERDLWRTDGTAEGTAFLHDVGPANYTSGTGSAAVGATLYFAGIGPSGVDTELWKSDGTTAGTVRVKDIRPGAESSVPTGFGVLDGIVYFAADDGTHGRELWRSDGSEAGTWLVKDIRPGAPGALSGDGYVANPDERVAYDGALYFSANQGSGFDLWRSDGSDAGTQRVVHIPVPAPTTGGLDQLQAALTVANGALFFVLVRDPNSGLYGVTLWKTNGTAEGTLAVEESAPAVSPGWPLVALADRLFFGGCDYAGGCEPWTSDGTSAGTFRVADVYPGGRSSNPYGFERLGGSLLVSARGAATGHELWSIPESAFPDRDGDGLYDVSEAALGTSPDDTDSDDDGLSDRDEVNRHGTSPLVADSDGDGFADGVEVAAGSDPLDAGSVPPAPPAVPALPPWGSALLASALLGSGWARLRTASRLR